MKLVAFLLLIGWGNAQKEVPKKRTLPHGLFPKELNGHSATVHHGVLDDSIADAESCGKRLSHLRSLIAAGQLQEALDLSLALQPHHRGSKTHPDCHADKPHVGEGSISTRIATPTDRHKSPSGKPVIDSFVKLHHDDPSLHEEVLRLVQGSSSASSAMRKSATRVPVVGFALDGKFVLADSPVRCTKGEATGDLSCSGGGDLRDHPVKAGTSEEVAQKVGDLLSEATKSKKDRKLMEVHMGKPLKGDATKIAEEANKKRASGPSTDAILGDIDTTYALGSKTTLVLPLVPTDGVDTDYQAGYSYPYGYDYGLVNSRHGSNIRSYLEECMKQNGDYYRNNSWGLMELDVTITPVLQVAYSGATCASHDSLTFWYGGTPDPTAYDTMAYAAALALGYDRANYDLNVIFIPTCSGLYFGGIGWVGVPGALQNTYLSNYDAAVAHELGHNLGANHASYFTGSSRGAEAFGTMSALSSAADWVEYGNPHSTMGQGDFEDFRADFVIEGKAVFDWVTDAELGEVVPYDAAGSSQCSPSCGPYYLSLTDTTTKPASGATMGLSIATATADRYFFVEHRTSSTSGHAALVSWADIRPSTGWDGETGIWENSVLVDCTPGTSDWFDAGCVPGASIVLDAGLSAATSRPVTLRVNQVEADGTLSVSVETNPSPTFMPTSTPAPTIDAAVTLVSGSCTVYGGNCMTSPNYPSNYDNNQDCEFRVVQSGTLSVNAFTLESYYDFLVVDGTAYSGSSGPDGVSVMHGSIITFSSDYSIVYAGFDICVGSGGSVTTNMPSPQPSPEPAPSPSPMPTVQPVVMPTPAPTPDPGVGTCFSGDSTVLVKTRDVTHTDGVGSSNAKYTVSRALTDVRAGDQVVAAVHRSGGLHVEKKFATVKKLLHSPSAEPFVDIRLHSGGAAVAGASGEEGELVGLRATEHHTFPRCPSSSSSALQSTPHLRSVVGSTGSSSSSSETASQVEAHELKAGDCLLTLQGERTVASARRRLAKAGEETYSVELEGTHDLLVVGGVVTHAKPAHEAGNVLQQLKAEKKLLAESKAKTHARLAAHGLVDP